MAHLFVLPKAVKRDLHYIYQHFPRGTKWFLKGVNQPKFSPACRAWITCTLASLWFYIAMWRGATSWLAKRGGVAIGALRQTDCQTSGRLTLPETNGWNLPVEMNVVGIWSFLSFWCQTILRGEVLGSVNVKRIGKTNSGWGRMCFFFQMKMEDSNYNSCPGLQVLFFAVHLNFRSRCNIPWKSTTILKMVVPFGRW